MKLAVFNGSPRGKGSNTGKLLELFLQGFTETPGNECELFYLIREKELSRCVTAFAEAEAVVMAFPLYTDCMPAVVKTFIEALEPSCSRAGGNPPLGFIVQSGFPESEQSHYLRRYLEKLTRRLGSPYLGTVIKGSGESIRAQPERMNAKLFSTFRALGSTFGGTGGFDEKLVEKLARPVRFSRFGLLWARLGGEMGKRLYWDPQLKKHGAYERRFAKPHLRQ